MEVAYLCRAREQEVFALTYDDLLEDGILLRRDKSSITELTRWSGRLKLAVSLARETCSSPYAKHLFHEKDGTPINPRKFSSRFKDCMRRRVAAGKLSAEERFTFHDLKGKGVSDHTENFSGYKTLSAKVIYLRKAVSVESTR